MFPWVNTKKCSTFVVNVSQFHRLTKCLAQKAAGQMHNPNNIRKRKKKVLAKDLGDFSDKVSMKQNRKQSREGKNGGKFGKYAEVMSILMDDSINQ